MLNQNIGFEIVKTKEQMKKFKEIWLEVCEEMTYESEEFHEKETATHYLYLNEKGDYIGTAEVGVYVPNEDSTVQYYYDFTKLPWIKENMGNVYEIDKVCILPEYRDIKLIKNLLYSLLAHHEMKQPAYYVTAMESTFYFAMKRRYKVPLIEIPDKEKRKQKFNDFYLYPLYFTLNDYIDFIMQGSNSILNKSQLNNIVNQLQESSVY